MEKKARPMGRKQKEVLNAMRDKKILVTHTQTTHNQYTIEGYGDVEPRIVDSLLERKEIKPCDFGLFPDCFPQTFERVAI